MSLSNIENQVLEILYKRDCEDQFEIAINKDCFACQETNTKVINMEIGYYLEKLSDLGYIEIGKSPKAFITGGMSDKKYRNNIIGINWESIKLSYKGRNYVVEYRKSLSDKVKESIIRFIRDIGTELRNRIIANIVSFFLGIVCTIIYFRFFYN